MFRTTRLSGGVDFGGATYDSIPDMKQTIHDYVIVGGGSAGCVLANRLSADPRISVLLLEAGGEANHPHVLVPAWSTKLMGNRRWDWCYATQPDPSRNERADLWPAGKVLGGGSSINGMVYVRGHAGDYDDWSAAGNPAWGYAQCLPYFIRAERNNRLGGEFHGRTGPLGVESLRVTHPLNALFIQSCQAAGLPFNPDCNGAVQEGVGPMQATQHGGMRDSTARAYLAPARGRTNLTVLTQAMANRVLFEGRRAASVEYRHRGIAGLAAAAREVILCAGSLASPKLLMLSGLGPSDHLGAHGIACRVDLPGVGLHLQEHPGVLVNFRMTVAALGHIARSWWRLALAGLDYAVRRAGPATSPVAHVVGYLKTDPQLGRPDIQLHFAPFAYQFEVDRVLVARDNRVGVALNVCRPASRGSIELRDGDPGSAPIIRHQLLGARTDIERLIAAGRFVRRVFAASPLGPICDAETAPGLGVETDAQWEHFVRANAFPMYHPVGTCRMGTDRESVVDQDLRVRGVTGLRVVDASIMPSLVSANTNAPVIMIAEKAADQIRHAAGS